jgi:hypothetical protein
MGGLKPIGSEKLVGMDKIRRIMEIANYNHELPNKDIELKSTEYRLGLSDGNSYEIVKERQGYIIKRNITESYSDYIEPMKNRRYYRSYSEALKKLNLMAKDFNSLYNNDEGTNLFTEQKKFKLKVPTPKADVAPEQAPTLPEPAPAPAPASEPTPAPTTGAEEDPMADLMGGTETTGTEEGPMADLGGDEDPMADLGGDEEPTDDEEENTGKENGVSFKLIQKLTGKLSQKIRKYLNSEEMDSDDVKYILNSVLSSLDLSVLDDEDVEEIIDRLEGDEEGDNEGDEEGGDEDITTDEEPEVEMPEPPSEEGEVTEYGYRNRNRMRVGPLGTRTDNMFSESKVDKIISGYFSINEDEKKVNNRKKIINEGLLKENMDVNEMEIKRLSKSIQQERSALKFLEKNPNAVLIGSTNKSNLLFKVGVNEHKISTDGRRVL